MGWAARANAQRAVPTPEARPMSCRRCRKLLVLKAGEVGWPDPGYTPEHLGLTRTCEERTYPYQEFPEAGRARGAALLTALAMSLGVGGPGAALPGVHPLPPGSGARTGRWRAGKKGP